MNEEWKNPTTMQDQNSQEIPATIQNPVHGYIFQLKVLMLFLYRGISHKYSFRLGTEVKEARKFDDLVFEYIHNDTKWYRLLQAKHKIDETKKITVEKLLFDIKGDYSLVKYFHSYQDCKRDKYFKNGIIKDVTICTNIDFDFEDLKKFNIEVEEAREKDDILDVKSETKQSIRYKFNSSILPILKKKLQTTKLNIGRKVYDDEIKNFLQHLVFAVNQPNEKELGYVIKEEIGEELDFITTENVYNKFFVKMVDWMKDKSKFMSYNEGKNLFHEVKRGSFLWYNIQDPVQSFTGRKEQLVVLHKLLQAGKNTIVCVCGLGGVGKSELVKKYVAEYSQSYDNKIVWINAESYQTLVDSFHILASDKLDITTINANGKAKKINSLVAEVYQYFSNLKCLFIFDNSEMYHSHNEFDSGIDRFLPILPNSCNKPNIIITSRNQKWPKSVKTLLLDGFTEHEAETFVSNRLHLKSNEQNEYIQNLGKQLQLLPLALQQAVEYIKAQNSELKKLEKKFQIIDYIESFSEKSKQLLSFELPSDCDNKYSKTVLSTWNITLDTLKSKVNGHYALELLNILAYLLPDNISVDLLSSIFKNEENLIPAIDLLKQYSLINVRNRVLSIHRLVQQVTRFKLIENHNEEKVLVEILTKVLYTVNSKNVDHFLSVWKYVYRHDFIFRDFNSALSAISQVLVSSGRSREAYSISMKNTKILDELPSNDVNVQYLRLKARIDSVDALLEHGKYKEALEKYQQILHNLINYEGWLELKFNLKSKIADTLERLGQDSAALEWYQNILTDYRIYYGENDPKTLMIERNIAGLFAQESKYDETLSIKQEIHRKLETSVGKDHHYTMLLKNDLADLLRQSGKIDEAMKLYKEVYNHRVSNFGNNGIIALNIQHNIGRLLRQCGKVKQAMKLCEEIYSHQINTLSENHPEILKTRTAIADVLVAQGNLKAALRIYREVYKIASEKFDDQHPYNINLLINIAVILHVQSKSEESLEILNDVLKKERYLYGFYHYHVAETLEFIGNIHMKHGQDTQTLKAHEELLQCQIRLFGINSHKTLPTRMIIFKILKKLNSRETALKQLTELYEIQKDASGVNDQTTLETRYDIGIMFYIDKQDYGKALNILTDVCKTQELILGKNHPTCVKIRENISSILSEQRIQRITKLIVAIKKNNLTELKRLLNEGSDVNSEDENKYTLLHHAINLNQPKTVELLLDNGADRTRCIGKGNTPLHMATSKGYLEVVKELLCHIHEDKLRDFIDAKTSNVGRTALHVAAKKGFSEIVTHLLSQGATYDLKNNAGQSALDVAFNHEIKEIFKKVDQMFEYAKSGSTELYDTLNKCSDEEYFTMVNPRNSQGYNLLQVAVSNNHKELVMLLQKLRGVQFYSFYSTTSIVEQITTEDIDALLNSNFTLNQVRGLVKAFDKRGVFNPNIYTIEGMLQLLESNGKSEFKELARQVIEFNMVMLRQSMNAVKLFDAERCNDVDAVEELIFKGTDVLFEAGRCNDVDAMEEFVFKFADLLFESGRHNDADAVEEVISKGADVSAKDNREWTPLHDGDNISNKKIAIVIGIFLSFIILITVKLVYCFFSFY